MQRRMSVLGTFAAATMVAMLASCGESDDGSSNEPSTPPSTRGAESTAPTEPTEPSGSASTTTPPVDPSDSSPSRARKAQIPATTLPGFNDEWTWTKQGAGPGPGQDVPSICQKASLTAIGAATEYRTDYNSPLDADAYAVQTTGVFPDAQTVATAQQVLKDWRKQCKAHATKDLGLERVDVGGLQTVSTDVGPGYQWLTTYGPAPSGSPDEGWFQAFGFVADGDTVTVLVMANVGQDYNYETGQQPMDLAVQEAARRLATSRG